MLIIELVYYTSFSPVWNRKRGCCLSMVLQQPYALRRKAIVLEASHILRDQIVMPDDYFDCDPDFFFAIVLRASPKIR